MKRIFVVVFLFFLLGLFAFQISIYMILGAVIAALFLVFKKQSSKTMCVFFILFFLVGIVTARLHMKLFDEKYTTLCKMKTYEGYVIDKNQNTYKVRNYSKNYCVYLSTYAKTIINPGDYIVFDGNVNEVPSGKKTIMYSNNINAYISSKSNSIQIVGRNTVVMLPVKIKERINKALIDIDKMGGSFVSGIVSGYTGQVDEKDIKRFKDEGISHILAVSGFNLGIIYFFASYILRRFPAKLRYFLIVFLCFFYTALSGFEPSITRAFIMILVHTGTKVINRPYELLNGVTLTAWIMLLFNSFTAYNIGFILSFAATYGIILLKDDIEDKIPKKLERFKGEVSVTLAAFISTLPAIMWYNGTFSPLSMLINILLGPLVVVITIISFIASALFVLTGSSLWFYPPVFLGRVFVQIIRVISQVNFLVYSGRPSLIFISSYYMLVMISFGYIKIRTSPKTAVIIKFGILFAIVVSLLYHPNKLTVHVINVGQGDSILVETPGRHIVLIDTGPEFGDYLGVKERVIPYMNLQGYGKVDLLILSHFHKDHAGGINYLLSNCKIDKILLYSKPEFDFENYETISKGDMITIDGVNINILFPQGELQDTREENETCLVMELKYGDFSMLLTADAEEKVMECISGSYDIYKVPHHGSKYSMSVKMLDNTSIGMAIISVGKNTFGHPSPEVINELEKRDIEVYRTDKNGNIIITTDGNSYSILSQYK